MLHIFKSYLSNPPKKKKKKKNDEISSPPYPLTRTVDRLQTYLKFSSK